MNEILSAKMLFSLLPMRKLSLVNETLRPETETRPRRLTFSSRRDRDRDLPTFLRDRDETETLGKCVSRPSRDRDVETETTSLGRTVQHHHYDQTFVALQDHVVVIRRVELIHTVRAGSTH